MSLSMADIRAEDGKLKDVKKKSAGCKLKDKGKSKEEDEDDSELLEDVDGDDGYTKEERSLYWAEVWKSHGFDVEGVVKKNKKRPPRYGLEPHYFESPDDCPTEIVLNAKLGIHWYNMLQGKNLQLSCVKKYNYLPRYMLGCTKYITCLATDPDCGISQVFLTGIVEDIFYLHRICCFVARPKIGQGEKKPVEPSNEEEEPEKDIEKYKPRSSTLPGWPSADALRDETRYYSVKKSDLLEHDWIRLYLELAFFNANHRKLTNLDLTKLVILRVVVESRPGVLEPPSERLKAVNSVFYFKYKYHPCKDRGARKGVRSLKAPRDRIAIIKRTVDKRSGRITLIFDHLYQFTLA